MKTTLKKVLSFTFAITLAMSLSAQDYILMRNGDDYNCKIAKINDKSVSFTVKKRGSLFKSESVEHTLPLDEVFMIKNEKRGTTFIVGNNRIMKPSVEIDKTADVLYLVKGEEIPVWQISLSNGILSYSKDKTRKKAMSNVGAVPIEEVFMVRYSDGSKDIFTDLHDMPADSGNDSAPASGEQRQLKVVFHNVKAGDTLGSIAERYNVSVDDIKEWNELNKSFKESYRPAGGTQLMIQVVIR